MGKKMRLPRTQTNRVFTLEELHAEFEKREEEIEKEAEYQLNNAKKDLEDGTTNE